MGWLKDLLSPSNIWTAFKFLFPNAAGVVVGWIAWGETWAAKLPITVPILVGLITAACILIILDAFHGWFDKRNKHVQRISELEADLKPKLRIVPTYYVYPKRDEPGIRTVRLDVTNVSNTVLKNCRLREARFVNVVGQESMMRRPFRLNDESLANMASHTYRQTFDLPGKGSVEIVEIAQLDERTDDSRVLMLYATAPNVPQLNSIVRECFPHRLTISVTAENMPTAFEKTYDLTIKDGRLRLDEVDV